MSEVPKDWSILKIGAVADINVRPKKDELDDEMLASFIPMACVEAETGKFSSPEVKKVGEVKKGYTPMRDGDVIFAKVTPCMENGKAAVVRGLKNGIGFGSTEFYSLRPKDNLVPEFLFYYIIQQGFRQEAERHMTGAVGLRRVPKAFIEEHEIPLPPLPEQRRIVARIEELFSQLDAGVAALRHAKAQLNRYRQSVLAAAVTGKLTQEWRERHQDVEPAEVLLERILKQRREQWNGSRKDKEVTIPNVENLPDLPIGWSWMPVQNLSEPKEDAIFAGPFGTIFKAKDFRDEGVPIIFLRHVGPDKYRTHKPGFMDREKWNEIFQPYSVWGGELLVTKLGEPPGVCCEYPEGIGPAMVTPDVMKFSVNEHAASKRYLISYFNSEIARRFTFGVAFGTTRLRLTLPIFRSMPVPLPPLAEQHQIVAEVEARTTAIDHLEAELDRQIARASRLRQSTLAAAFSGRF